MVRNLTNHNVDTKSMKLNLFPVLNTLPGNVGNSSTQSFEEGGLCYVILNESKGEESLLQLLIAPDDEGKDIVAI
ncbi:hypothetical protein E2C01_015144 [Portunus trituberculatus]|uniref:Uncharacterized protein n=1 Tax=Portunus trituberculatus TaxID=210409 RepID=A0A5B7DLX7_PORTR|nr:hypothetical protein [Portunus trituberculatus]